MAEQGTERQQVPSFARGPETTELRGDCPKSIVNVLDAVSMARDQTRTQLVNEILGTWADKVRHEATMVHRVTAGNPPVAERVGGAA